MFSGPTTTVSRNTKNAHIYLVCVFFDLPTFLEITLLKTNKYSLKNASHSKKNNFVA